MQQEKGGGFSVKACDVCVGQIVVIIGFYLIHREMSQPSPGRGSAQPG